MIRDDSVYLAHIRDAIQQIIAYTEGMDLSAGVGRWQADPELSLAPRQETNYSKSEEPALLLLPVF